MNQDFENSVENEDIHLEAAAQVLDNEYDLEQNLSEVDTGEGIVTDGGQSFKKDAIKGYLGGAGVSAVGAAKELLHDLPEAWEMAQYTGDAVSASDELATGAAFAVGAYALGKRGLEIAYEE